jgi:excisionase family DNA binding protein
MTNFHEEHATLLTIPEVALRLRVSESTVYRMLHDDELASVKIRGCTRIACSNLSSLIEQDAGGDS